MQSKRPEVRFVDGLRVYAPNERAPDFVKANLVISRAELVRWLEGEGETVRIDVKVGRSGAWYAAVNDWKPPTTTSDLREEAVARPAPSDEDIPF